MAWMDPLTANLLDLLFGLRKHPVPLSIGGGFGLYLLRLAWPMHEGAARFLRRQGREPRIGYAGINKSAWLGSAAVAMVFRGSSRPGREWRCARRPGSSDAPGGRASWSLAMPARSSLPEIPLRRGWLSRVKSAVLHVISLAQFTKSSSVGNRSLAKAKAWQCGLPWDAMKANSTSVLINGIL